MPLISPFLLVAVAAAIAISKLTSDSELEPKADMIGT